MFHRCGSSVLLFVTASFPQVCGCCSSVQAQEAKAAPTVTYSVSIAGMTCESCATHIQKSIAKLPGVAKVSVDYQGGHAWVTVLTPRQEGVRTEEPRRISAELAAAVEQAGYTPTVNYVLMVKGMTCEACSNHVEQAVARVPGVLGVKVNYKGGFAVVVPSPKASDLSVSLVDSVEQAGDTAAVQTRP